MPGVLSEPAVTTRMEDHRETREGCYSAHNDTHAAAFFPDIYQTKSSQKPVDKQDDRMDVDMDYTKPPRKSFNEPDDKMDPSNDRASMLSGSTLVSTKSPRFPLRGKWWVKRERREREEREAEEQKLEEEHRENERLESVNEAVEFLEEFARDGWSENFENGQVKIHCDLTMDEVKEIGRLNKVDGTRRCLDLFTATYIHDAMGRALYEKLSAQVPKEGLDMITEEDDAIAVTEENLALGTTSPKMAGKQTEKRKRGGSVPLDDRWATSTARRATEGDVIPVVRRSSSAQAVAESERNRRSTVSGEVLVRPDQVLCTTCGSRAMGFVEEDEAMAMDEDEGGDEERHADKKRMSLSRRISVKMSEKLTSIGGDVASGYGGSRLIA